MRQTRALCKFKWAKEWGEGVARVCRRARQMTLCAPKWGAATESRKEVPLKGPQERNCFGARQSDTQCAGGAEFFGLKRGFHAAAEITGGERSWISAAVSRSMIFMGPPQLGQR